VANNPLIYVDPSGNTWEWVNDAWQLTKDTAIAVWNTRVNVAHVLVLDGVRMVLDSEVSLKDRFMAGVSLIPVPGSKVTKGAQFAKGDGEG